MPEVSHHNHYEELGDTTSLTTLAHPEANIGYFQYC